MIFLYIYISILQNFLIIYENQKITEEGGLIRGGGKEKKVCETSSKKKDCLILI
jgi:hypothetical protein